MSSTAAERLPAYLAVREIFLTQLRLVFDSATDGEIGATAKRLELFINRNIILGNNQETDCLVDWMVFQHRRQGRTLAQIAHESRGPSEPADVRAVLAGMAEATLGLFRVLDTDPGVGLQVANTWTDQRCFMFEREVSRQANQGDQLLLRLLTVGDITFSGALVLSMPAPLLNAMRQEQAAGKLDSIDAISVAGPRQDNFFGSIIAALMSVRRPAPAPMPAREHDKKVGRNEPCPCGSGKKYKKCCGR
jgi:hypothetical protein